jgi:hypothetical protein
MATNHLPPFIANKWKYRCPSLDNARQSGKPPLEREFLRGMLPPGAAMLNPDRPAVCSKSFNSDRLGQITRLVDVGPQDERRMVRKKLQRQAEDERRH